MIQSAGFRDLITLLTNSQFNIPSTNAIMDTLDSQYRMMRMKLMDVISQQPHICTTADIWTSKSQSYFGMTVHWINSNYERESYVLAFRRMKERHTNEEITKIIREIFRDYRINMDNITNMITDGGSAFCKAFKQFGKSVDTLIDPNVRNSEPDEQNHDPGNENSRSNLPFMQSDDGEEFYSNIIDFDTVQSEQHDLDTGIDPEEESLFELQSSPNEMLPNEPDLYEFDLTSDENPTPDAAVDEYETKKLPAHKRCLSHVLNLIGNDFTTALTGAAKRQWVATLSKLQSIWVFPRRSSLAKEYCKQILGFVLMIPVETRWNSEYDSVAKVAAIGIDKINEYVDKLNLEFKSAAHIQRLTKEDGIMIQIYLKVMKPVAKWQFLWTNYRVNKKVIKVSYYLHYLP